jgi:hypothetical protein
MHLSGRKLHRLFVLALLGAVALIPLVGSANSGFYQTPLFGIQTMPDGSLLVADAGQGIVDADDGSLIAQLPGVSDIAPMDDGGLWALTGIQPGPSTLFRVDAAGNAVPFADIFGFEAKRNPHPAEIDSNAFDVADLGGGEALVADAGGNDLLKVNKHGKVKLVAVLPTELASTANVKNIIGCPTPPSPDLIEICELPPMIPAEPVATSIAVGPDGAYYVGELKGFPAPTGESRVWRIEPNARNAKCGHSPLCSVALDGFTSVIDLTFGPDGRLYVTQIDDASWLAVELAAEGFEATVGGSVHACDLQTQVCEHLVSGIPILTSIAFRDDGSLWGSTWSLVPGMGDVVPLVP